MSQIKSRSFLEHNYRAVWHDGVTMRFKYNSDKPITELDWPEFYDVKLTNYCESQCEWCYQNSTSKDRHFERVIDKIVSFFGNMSENEKPFQVAIGGGEPTSHPDFIRVLQAFHEMDICPNYTTNGMFVAKSYCDDILKVSKEYCGGVAISTHPHISRFWKKAAQLMCDSNIMTNFHVIISDKHSIDEFVSLREEWRDRVKYFVLLPYTMQGRAKSRRVVEWDYLVSKIRDDHKNIAFGANFYPQLQKTRGFCLSLYEPEIMSKYLDLENNGTLYKSSFNVEVPVRKNVFM